MWYHNAFSGLMGLSMILPFFVVIRIIRPLSMMYLSVLILLGVIIIGLRIYKWWQILPLPLGLFILANIMPFSSIASYNFVYLFWVSCVWGPILIYSTHKVFFLEMWEKWNKKEPGPLKKYPPISSYI